MGRKSFNACTAALIALGLMLTVGPAAAPARGGSFKATNLITDDQTVNQAQITDSSLKNAWGVSFGANTAFWVSENGSAQTTLYTVDPTTDATARVTFNGGFVTIPGAGNPTGQVFNTENATSFNNNLFLFVSEDGTISGWRGSIGLGGTAEVLQTASTDNVYKGTALDVFGGNAYLLSANFHSGNIDVMKGVPGAPNLPGNFVDPNLTAGYAPFNVQRLGNTIYVTYALQDADKHDDMKGAGHGFVSAFNLDGTFIGRVGSMGTLNSPWGLAIAPTSFGSIAGDLLVGNFGDGHINIFNPTPGPNDFIGQLTDDKGNPLAIDGLWALTPGNDTSAGSSQKIYFSAGPGDEMHGLFGVITPVPEPSTALLGLLALGLVTAGRRWSKHRSHAAD
jgi:uncharacterized protein (TIGR03118 family)